MAIRAQIEKRQTVYKTRVESAKKAHIKPPMENSKAFADPPFPVSVAVAAGVLVAAFLSAAVDVGVAVAFAGPAALATKDPEARG
jgi:hypothetical protein